MVACSQLQTRVGVLKMQPKEQSFKHWQRELADYCRTENLKEIPGITSDERVSTYRELVFNIIKNALSSAYPLTKELLGDDEWNVLIKDFHANYPSESPELWSMPYGLYDYIQQTKMFSEKYPFIEELLFLEWVEIEVYMMEDEELKDFSPLGDIKSDKIIINPEYRLISFSYPVFKKRIQELRNGVELGQFVLMVFRHPETKSVKFIEVSPLCARLIEILDEQVQSISSATDRMAKEHNLNLNEETKLQLEEFIKLMITEKVVLGYSKN